jgi:hypothetical protein
MTLKKVLFYLLIIMLVYATLVQYNDPDPYVWMPVYLIPAYLLYRKLSTRPDKLLYFIIGLIYLLWSINQFPPEWEGLMFDTMKMKTLNIELGRESLGLACCTLFLWLSLAFD